MSKTAQIKRIREISITDFLHAINVEPAKQIRDELYYCSPFRIENTPSFAVSTTKNVWFDHGAGTEHQGGDIIDLVMQVLHVDLQTAIQMLEQIAVNPQVNQATAAKAPATAREPKAAAKTSMQITKVEEFTSTILNTYLRSRGIKTELLQASAQTMSFLKTVYYQVEGKSREFFAIGWKNGAGDYELRSKNFQSFIGKKKTFTFIKGKVPGVAIFESFIDYFSAITYYGKPSLGYDILILNSTRLAKSTLELVLAQPAIHLFLDNDKAGLDAVAYYKKNCKGIQVHNHGHLYAGFKDFNDKLTNTPPQKPLPGSNDSNSEASQKARWWLWVVFHDQENGEDKQRTFYCYNNSESGLEQLLNLRAHELENPKMSRLCERTTGREYKVLEEAWH
jgi:hypothetical protein